MSSRFLTLYVTYGDLVDRYGKDDPDLETMTSKVQSTTAQAGLPKRGGHLWGKSSPKRLSHTPSRLARFT